MGDFSQMTHLSSFYQHFKEHQSEAALSGESFSLGTFLVLHYAKGSTPHHPDSQSHHKLPLKSIQGFQWLEGKLMTFPVFNLCDRFFRFLILDADPLPEGIRASIFRPPLLS